MIELGQLEGRHAEFSNRGLRVLLVSWEGREDAIKTQKEFPHFLALADSGGKLITAAGTVHAKAGPNGGDIAAPTTVLIDKTGVVRWLFRPDRYFSRITPDQLLVQVDRHLQ